MVAGEAQKYEDVASHVQERKISYPVLHDPASVNAKAYGVGGSPHAFVIGRDGKVVWEGRCGPGKDQETCEAALKAALAPARVAEPKKGA